MRRPIMPINSSTCIGVLTACLSWIHLAVFLKTSSICLIHGLQSQPFYTTLPPQSLYEFVPFLFLDNSRFTNYSYT